MRYPTRDKLKHLGLDTEFLRWLEGEADRLPRWHAIRDVTGEDYAAAIRAATWLEGLSAPSEIGSPLKDWRARYRLLQRFLYEALKESMFFSSLKLIDDLAALEKVLETLLPESAWKPYRQDILHLRRLGKPLRLHKSRSGRRTGGKYESEQTQRMRAAVEYVRSVSKKPYDDLAEFWNECANGSKEYYSDAIRSRLRKGHKLNRTRDAAKSILDHWKSIYKLDLTSVSPGPFPLSDEIAALVKNCNQQQNTSRN